MVSEIQPEKGENITLKKNLFEENKIFCDVCKLWISGVLDIDSHFIIHSFKTWPAASRSATLTEVLKQKTDNLAEYKHRLSEASRISIITDPGKGKQQKLLTSLFDYKGFTERINKYFEGDDDALLNSSFTDPEDDDNASTATTVQRGDLSHNPLQSKTGGEKQEKIGRTKRLANNDTEYGQKQKIKVETESPYFTNTDDNKNEIDNGKCQSHKKSESEYESTLRIENVLQLHNTIDFITEQEELHSDYKPSLVFPAELIQNYDTVPKKSIETLQITGETMKTIKRENLTPSPLKFCKISPLPSGEVSPLPARDAKRNSYLQTVDVPQKKAKLQKVESPGKRNKNRKSVKNANKTMYKSSSILDRYTIIQPNPECGRKRSLNTDSDSSLKSVRSKYKSSNFEKESKSNKNKNKEKDTPEKLYLRKSISHIQRQLKRLSQEKTLASSIKEKAAKEKEKNKRNGNKLEEYIEMRNKTDTPLSEEQIRQLRLIREEVITTPFMRKPSEGVEEAMAATYNLRYMELRINVMPIKDSLKIFHGLQNYNLLKSEFERCTNRSLKQLPRRLNTFFEELIHKERLYSKMSDKYHVCKKAMQKLNSSQQLDMKLLQNVGMILFGYKVTKGNWHGPLFQCREKGNSVILDKPTPFIDIVKGDLWTSFKKMDLYVERTKIGSAQNFYDAVIMAYTVYWIFNLEYEDSLRPVFEYFDWIVGNRQNTYK